MPESVLREEVARLKAQLAESRAESERERRIRSEAELEKEHFRAQMHRVALALKREREKSAAVARQELEQLRLEFLAREERYVLDGDRDELRTIRYELAKLRAQAGGMPDVGAGGGAGAGAGAGTGSGSAADAGFAHGSLSPSPSPPPKGSRGNVYRLQNELSVLLASGYDQDDEAVSALQAAIAVERDGQ